jgi:hypothetical protein
MSGPRARTADSDGIINGLFDRCAWAAYLDQASEQQGWPDSVATRQRAYDYYEAALAEKHQLRAAGQRPGQNRVPDVSMPLMAEEAARQSRLTSAHTAEADDLAFIDATADTGT